ncbi:hypothetical protein PGB90_009048 [Kerria lacca]
MSLHSLESITKLTVSDEIEVSDVDSVGDIVLVPSVEEHTSSLSTDEVKKIFEILKKGEQILKVDQRKLVLLLGITGSGKTTLVQLLAGDNCQLFSQEFGKTGEFMIEDNNGKIKAGIVSQTIYPELTLDSDTNVMFCDTPGFDDTRGTAVDIAAMYFLKEIIQNTEKIKILLVINHSSLRIGVDRKDFINLIQHTVTLLKNIKKFENSIALVVTKVDNCYKKIDENIYLVPDSSIIEYISEFLRTTNEDFAAVAEGEMLQQANYLIDILLTNTSTGGYKRIGLIRRPDEVGPISKMPLLQKEKIQIKNIIEENLTYTNVKENVFGYSISEKSKNDIYVIVEYINYKIVNQVKIIGSIIEEYYKMKEWYSEDINKFYSEISKILVKIRKDLESMDEDISLKEFEKMLLELVDDLNINYNKIQTFELQQQDKYLEFLEVVSERKFENSSLIWKNGLSEIIEYFNTCETWYKFLIDLYEKLSSYEVQIKRNCYKLICESNILCLNDEKFQSFVIKLIPSFNFEEIENLVIDKIKLGTLNKLLKSSLVHSTTCTYDSTFGSYLIEGDFVILSSFQLSSHTNATFDDVPSLQPIGYKY